MHLFVYFSLLFQGLVAVFRWLVNKTGKNFANIEELTQRFPDEDNLHIRIEKCKKLFWIGYARSKLEVRPKLEIRLCTEYQNSKGQCDGDCGKLHLCRLNLLSPKFCSSPCDNKLSHSIVSEHNTTILHAALPISMHNERYVKQIQMLIRSSLPRLCSNFQEKGKCENGYCGYLHICLENLYGNCEGSCKLAMKSGITKSVVHDFRKGHNAKVLQNFGYKQTGHFFKEELLHNILLPKDNNTQERRDQYDSDSDQSDASSTVSDVGCKYSEDILFHQGIKVLSILLLQYYKPS